MTRGNAIERRTRRRYVTLARKQSDTHLTFVARKPDRAHVSCTLLFTNQFNDVANLAFTEATRVNSVLVFSSFFFFNLGVNVLSLSLSRSLNVHKQRRAPNVPRQKSVIQSRDTSNYPARGKQTLRRDNIRSENVQRQEGRRA